MPQSLVQIYLHLVFSTKLRTSFLKDLETRKGVHAYLGGTCRSLDSPSMIVGGADDHVHILCSQSKNLSVSDLVRDLKRSSSISIKEQSPALADFHWQNGYGAFSISPSHVESLVAYIENQEKHHRRFSFQDEFRRLCQKYAVQIDERYVWD
jgi:REP element-mobilizing transposase RayT